MVISPPNRPTTTSLPPLVRQSMPSRSVLDEPTKSTTAHTPPPAAALIWSAASAAAESTTASAPAAPAASRLAAAQAPVAGAAADPRIGEPPLADGEPLGVGPERHHLAHRLVPHHQRQRHAAVGQLELPAAAQVVSALPEVQVAVTDAGGEHA